MSAAVELPGAAAAEQIYLEQRVREEAEAAATASTVSAMLAHVNLAIGYARRFGQAGERAGAVSPDQWLTENRLW